MNDKQPGQRPGKDNQEHGAWVCPLYGCPLTEPVMGTWADMQEHFRTCHPDYKGHVIMCRL